MTIKFIFQMYIPDNQGRVFSLGNFRDIDSNTSLEDFYPYWDTTEYDTPEEMRAYAVSLVLAEASARGYTGFTENDISYLSLDPVLVYQNGVKKSDPNIVVQSATVADGVASFNLTDDGTPTGNAVFSDVFEDSAHFLIDDANDLYNFSGITVSGDKKTLSVVVRRALLSLGAIIYGNAVDGTVVRMQVMGK